MFFSTGGKCKDPYCEYLMPAFGQTPIIEKAAMLADGEIGRRSSAKLTTMANFELTRGK